MTGGTGENFEENGGGASRNSTCAKQKTDKKKNNGLRRETGKNGKSNAKARRTRRSTEKRRAPECLPTATGHGEKSGGAVTFRRTVKIWPRGWAGGSEGVEGARGRNRSQTVRNKNHPKRSPGGVTFWEECSDKRSRKNPGSPRN